jgi:glycosyltransferase involved in cell wall biosynthesis
VIALRRGSVPEVIEHGRTGIVVDDLAAMAAAIGDAVALDPVELRRAAEERFSNERMVAHYVRIYEDAVT